MRRMMLVAGVATLAISAPVAAQGKGGGHGHGGGQAAKVERGGGGGGNARAMKADRGQSRAMNVDRGQGRSNVFARSSGQQRSARSEQRGRSMRFASFQEHGRGKAHVETRARGDSEQVRVRGSSKHMEARGRDRIELRGNGNRTRVAEIRTNGRHGRDDNVVQIRNRDRVIEARNVARTRDFDGDRWTRIFGDRGVPAGFVNGCPPGLAKKSPACVPPGQAKNAGAAAVLGSALPTIYASNALPIGLRDIYRDNDDYYYRYGDGYVYRVERDNNLVNALLPLIGAGFGIGQQFPYMNSPNYYVPSYYQSFYPDNGYYDYRYANGYVYQVDPYNGMIDNMIPLLDRGYGVGQMLPASYSYYNVPYQYRDIYADNSDYYYRYAPGAIYQVDRDTQLITALASLLTGGLSVGQPLPATYSAYNVPLAYRSQYYDTADNWYRYSDGYIYQVDPTTRLISAIVQAIV